MTDQQVSTGMRGIIGHYLESIPLIALRYVYTLAGVHVV